MANLTFEEFLSLLRFVARIVELEVSEEVSVEAGGIWVQTIMTDDYVMELSE